MDSLLKEPILACRLICLILAKLKHRHTKETHLDVLARLHKKPAYLQLKDYNLCPKTRSQMNQLCLFKTQLLNAKLLEHIQTLLLQSNYYCLDLLDYFIGESEAIKLPNMSCLTQVARRPFLSTKDLFVALKLCS